MISTLSRRLFLNVCENREGCVNKFSTVVKSTLVKSMAASAKQSQKKVNLPLYQQLTEKNMVVAVSEEEVVEAISILKESSVIGFDAQTKFEYIKGTKPTGPHLIQLSTKDKTYFFQMCDDIHNQRKIDLTTLTKLLKSILESTTIRKVGFNMKNHYPLLKENYNITVENGRDLNLLMRDENKNPISKKAIVAQILGQKYVADELLMKCNWLRPICSYLPKQKQYAGNNPHMALTVYSHWIDEKLKRKEEKNLKKKEAKYQARLVKSSVGTETQSSAAATTGTIESQISESTK